MASIFLLLLSFPEYSITSQHLSKAIMWLIRQPFAKLFTNNAATARLTSSSTNTVFFPSLDVTLSM